VKRGKSWDELSGTQRALVVLAGTVQLSLLFAALRDLRRRPADQINGSKRQWVALSFVNFVGPISYFLFGRKR
jgi:hypothetical protein